MRPLCSTITTAALATLAAITMTGCGGDPNDSTDDTSAEIRGDRPTDPTRDPSRDPTRDTTRDPPEAERPNVIECRTDDVCPRGSYCEAGLNYCFTGSRCIVDGRPSNAFCARTYGEGFICHEYATESWHCVPIEVEEPVCRGVIECRVDDSCPRGTFCDTSVNYCTTGTRCVERIHDTCAREYGENFVCGRTSHCTPLERQLCER
jgi:hypothetical protein